MAAITSVGSWNGNLGGSTFWGLCRQVGPWKSTPIDEVRANSRPGYPYANAGNAFSSASIHPYIQTLPPVKLGSNNSNLYVENDFGAPNTPVIKKSPRGPSGEGGKYIMDRSTGFWKRVFGKFGGGRESMTTFSPKSGGGPGPGVFGATPIMSPMVKKKPNLNLDDKVSKKSKTASGRNKFGLSVETQNLFENNPVPGSPITGSVPGRISSGSVSSTHASRALSRYKRGAPSTTPKTPKKTKANSPEDSNI